MHRNARWTLPDALAVKRGAREAAGSQDQKRMRDEATAELL